MPENKTPNWTPQQLQAIKARNADVLVSASAGTGKTAVLSGRCVDLIADNTDNQVFLSGNLKSAALGLCAGVN